MKNNKIIKVNKKDVVSKLDSINISEYDKYSIIGFFENANEKEVTDFIIGEFVKNYYESFTKKGNDEKSDSLLNSDNSENN